MAPEPKFPKFQQEKKCVHVLGGKYWQMKPAPQVTVYMMLLFNYVH